MIYKNSRYSGYIAVIMAVVLLITALLTGCEKENNSLPTQASPCESAPTAPENATVPATASSSAAATAASESPSAAEATQAEQSDQTEPAEIKFPDSLQALMEEGGVTAEDLSLLACRQLVTVDSSGSDAEIRFYALNNGAWTDEEDMTCSGYVGHNGVTADMHEGGMATPFGLYSISEAFYFYDEPDTGLPTFKVTEDTYWVDDPDSAYYNRHMEGSAKKDWNSAEHMIDFPATYEYGFVIDYNLAGEYAKGSAIFFHIKYEPTYGCVATNRDSVLRYLAALDIDEYPYILIV